MTNEDWPLHCPRCGERIGMYEAISVIDGDGSAVLVTRDEVRADPPRYEGWVFHDACLTSAR
jgi:hypothetical protein